MELLVILKAESETTHLIKYLKKQQIVKSVILRSDNHKPQKVIITNKEMMIAIVKTSSLALEKFMENESDEKMF